MSRGRTRSTHGAFSFITMIRTSGAQVFFAPLSFVRTNLAMHCPVCEKLFKLIQSIDWWIFTHHVDAHAKYSVTHWAARWHCFCGTTFPLMQELEDHLKQAADEEGFEAHMVLGELAR